MHTLALVLALFAEAPDAPAPAPDVPAAGVTPPATSSPPATAPAPARTRAAPSPAPRPVAQPPPQTPFRLSLGYTRVLAEDGELAGANQTTQAIGLEMAFPSGSYVRNHLVLAHQWETGSGITARGFRVDLISLGYPIDLVDRAVHMALEPTLVVLRGEILFVENGPRLLRLDSGFALDLSVAFRQWFVSVAPEIDFRYLIYGSDGHRTGFARLFPVRFALGHEF